ncbi:DUF4435 domain-containing protein [Brevibacillus sp. FIR094]|uniref:DUF4435 domain-containing protein n=1 Tax=Brevibacillus sp. FIR094 TaxID=3134809 RepID=UPI003D23A06F
MTDFYLTIEEKINTTLLEKHPIPALIVEGSTDIQVYGHLLKKSEVNWELMDFVVGNCKNDIEKNMQAGLPFRYIAILDSDFERYKDELITDNENLIYTHYYNMENYLTCKEVIDSTIEDLRLVNSPQISSEKIIHDAIDSISPIIIGSLIKIDNDWNFPLESYGIEHKEWWDNDVNQVNAEKLKCFITNKGVCLTDEIWIKGATLLSQIRDTERIDLILNGKQKIDAVYHQFKKTFPHIMSCRNKKVFKFDLCKNIHNSKSTLELITEIDSKVSTLLQ